MIDRMMRIRNELGPILLGAWLGAALFFSAVVAPGVFAVLRGFALPNANEIAGSVVTRTLTVINVSGFLIGLVLLIATLGLRSTISARGFTLMTQVLSLAALAVTTAVGHWIIAARMLSLRTAMAIIDRVAANDPRRLAFNKLHGYSVALLSAAMIAAIIAMVAIVLGRRGTRQ